MPDTITYPAPAPTCAPGKLDLYVMAGLVAAQPPFNLAGAATTRVLIGPCNASSGDTIVASIAQVTPPGCMELVADARTFSIVVHATGHGVLTVQNTSRGASAQADVFAAV